MTEVDKQDQLRRLVRMRDQGRISAEEYREHKALLIGDGDDLPEPDLTELQGSKTPPPGTGPDRTPEEWLVHLLREGNLEAQQQTELIRSIRVWVVFFGILAVLAILGWILVLVAF